MANTAFCSFIVKIRLNHKYRFDAVLHFAREAFGLTFRGKDATPCRGFRFPGVTQSSLMTDCEGIPSDKELAYGLKKETPSPYGSE
jgi:hypothetical protein